MAGGGTLVLSGTNTFTGGTSVAAGTFDLSNQNALQGSTLTTGGGLVVFDSAVSSHAFSFGGLAGAAGLNLINNGGNAIALSVGGNNQSTTFSGVLTGRNGGSLVKAGAGTLTLAGSSTFTGGATVSGGTLLLANTGALSGSTLDTSGAGSMSFGALGSASFGALQGSGGLPLTSTASSGVALTAGGTGPRRPLPARWAAWAA